jgi:thioesterase domain-containing protein
MKPVLFFFPGAGLEGGVAQTLAAMMPEFEVVGITYPGWPELTDPAVAMDHLLASAACQIRTHSNFSPLLILGYSLGAQIGWGLANAFQREGTPVAFFGAISGRVVPVDKPQKRWMQRAVRDFGEHLMRGDLRGAGTFVSARFSRLLQRAAGRDLPQMAARWAKRGRLPWYLASNPTFERELHMRLLIKAAGPWAQNLEREWPPLQCPSLLVRGPEDEVFDATWRALCPHVQIQPSRCTHSAILQPPHLQEVVALFKSAIAESAARATPVCVSDS